MQKIKNQVLISLGLLVIIFILAGIISYAIVTSRSNNGPLQQAKEDINGEKIIDSDLPKLECNYNNDKDVYKDAVARKDVNICSCTKDKEERQKCRMVVVDINLYQQALKQLDDSLCDKIKSKFQKKACYKVVQSSIEKIKKDNPTYLAKVYVFSHNEKAIDELENLVTNSGQNIDMRISLAMAYAEKGLKEQEQGNSQIPYVEKAIKAAKEAINLDSKSSEAYRALGYAYEIKPDTTKAIASYDRAISLNKGNLMAYAGRGHVYKLIGSLDQAVVDFKKAAELDSNNKNVFIYTNLCNLEYSRSNNKEAIKNCKIVTQIKNTDIVFQSEAYQTMAQIFIDKNEFQQAKDYLLKAKTLTPNDSNLFVTFAQLNLKSGNYKQAEVDATKAIDLSPLKAVGYLKLSYALYMQDKFKEAIKSAEKGIDLVDNDVSLLQSGKPATKRDLNYSIANSYRQLGDTEKEQEYNNRAVK